MEFRRGGDVDWKRGSRIEGNGGGTLIFEGEVLEIESPRRLVHSLTALWGEDVKSEGHFAGDLGDSQVRDSCRLVVTHEQLREGANEQPVWRLADGAFRYQDAAETGEILTTPGSLRWLEGQAKPDAGGALIADGPR